MVLIAEQCNLIVFCTRVPNPSHCIRLWKNYSRVFQSYLHLISVFANGGFGTIYINFYNTPWCYIEPIWVQYSTVQWGLYGMKHIVAAVLFETRNISNCFCYHNFSLIDFSALLNQIHIPVYYVYTPRVWSIQFANINNFFFYSFLIIFCATGDWPLWAKSLATSP